MLTMPSPFTMSHPGEYVGSLASERAAEQWQERYDEAYGTLEDALGEAAAAIGEDLPAGGRTIATARSILLAQDRVKAVADALGALLTVVNE
jgi:hypothetical protein